MTRCIAGARRDGSLRSVRAGALLSFRWHWNMPTNTEKEFAPICPNFSPLRPSFRPRTHVRPSRSTADRSVPPLVDPVLSPFKGL
jgi:hypothetical protein